MTLVGARFESTNKLRIVETTSAEFNLLTAASEFCMYHSLGRTRFDCTIIVLPLVLPVLAVPDLPRSDLALPFRRLLPASARADPLSVLLQVSALAQESGRALEAMRAELEARQFEDARAAEEALERLRSEAEDLRARTCEQLDELDTHHT